MQFKIFLQSPHFAENRLQHVRSSGPGAIVCKSHVTHRALIMCNMSCYVPRGMEGQLSCYIWQSWNCIYLSFVLLAEPLTDEGGEETGVPGENPWRRASENRIISWSGWLDCVYCDRVRQAGCTFRISLITLTTLWEDLSHMDVKQLFCKHVL